MHRFYANNVHTNQEICNDAEMRDSAPDIPDIVFDSLVTWK